MFSIADNLVNVRQRIKKSELAAGCVPQSVRLLAVSKTKSAEILYQAVLAGQMNFGESYVNEAIPKQRALQHMCTGELSEQLVWHFIGPLQSNKTRLVAEHFDWVQSIDREKIARRLNDQRPRHLAPLNVCIQVNIDHEASKSGLESQDVMLLAEQISAFPELKLRGLMAIPKAGQSEASQRRSFLAMKALYIRLQLRFPGIDTLSMGMSGDFETAIECGANMVRVGSALFGQR